MIELLTLLLLCGAMLYHSLGISLLVIGIISALTSAFFFIYFLSKKGMVFGMLTGFMIFLGAVTMWYYAVTVPQSFFSDRTVFGVVESVDRRLDKTLLVVRDQNFDALLQVTIHTSSNVLPGDKVEVHGAIQQPEDFITSSGRLFGYQSYLQAKGIVGVIPVGTVALSMPGNFSLTRLATIMRFRIADILTQYVTFPIDGVVAGIIVGYQGGVPQAIEDLFRTTGVLHVLVLSGENITLLAVFLSILLRPMPFRLRTFLTAMAIVLVVLISGAGVSAVRAGIMGIIALSASLVRRSYVPFRALTLSVLFFFFTSPQTIFADPGFHLSVLATIFMIVVLPKAEKWFQWLPEKYGVRELVILGICVPTFMLPYTMYFSGLVPLASPLANILMAFVTPLMMLCGAIVLAVSWLGPIAQLVGTLVSYVGKIIIKLLVALNTFPQLNAPPLAWWGVVLSYLVFFTMLFRFELKQFWHELKSSFLPQTNSSERENQ
jgi:predicted membrane metal-binding protein